jgi:hypothetical protein
MSLETKTITAFVTLLKNSTLASGGLLFEDPKILCSPSLQQG